MYLYLSYIFSWMSSNIFPLVSQTSISGFLCIVSNILNAADWPTANALMQGDAYPAGLRVLWAHWSYLVSQEKSSPCTGPDWWVLQPSWHFQSLSCDSFHANLANGSDSTLPLISLATSTWTTLAWPLHEPLAKRSYLRHCHFHPNWHCITHNMERNHEDVTKLDGFKEFDVFVTEWDR